LIALGVASDLGIRRRVVLPFDADRFRRTSVADRPGDWGAQFDRLIADLRPGSDVIVLDSAVDDVKAYQAANTRILDEAEALGRDADMDVVALLVWEGQGRGDDDMTQEFGDAARARGMRIVEVRTV
jgi:hypothetical protein